MWQKSNKTEKESFQFGRVTFSVRGAEAFAFVLANTPFVMPQSCRVRQNCIHYVPATERHCKYPVNGIKDL